LPELLKISELASRAGVEKSTVQHYLREGLLPPPAAKPHRNMAYYSSDTVERIKLIRELQSRRFLPLARIKELLDDSEGIDELRLYVANDPGGLTDGASASEPATRAEVIAQTNIPAESLDRLEEAGFVHPSEGESDDEIVYSQIDTTILRALASMEAAGLNAENGFHIEDMGFYLDATRALIGKEVALFSQVMGRLPRDKVLKMARAGLGGSNRLVVALRQKVFLQLLGEISSDDNAS
jgi:DNA-binding transcriptional MerR regulator